MSGVFFRVIMCSILETVFACFFRMAQQAEIIKI